MSVNACKMTQKCTMSKEARANAIRANSKLVWKIPTFATSSLSSSVLIRFDDGHSDSHSLFAFVGFGDANLCVLGTFERWVVGKGA